MHPNPVFRKSPDETNLGFARDRGFGTLLINGDNAPLLAHIPFSLSEDGTFADLHMLRSNPITRALGQPKPAVLAISGPDSYVSPDWYDIDDQVPTWNYVAVHLRGTLTQLPAEQLRASLDTLAAQFEDRLVPKTPWTNDKMTPEVLAKMMRMIVPFRFDVTSVDGTWKLGQNKPDATRQSAAKHVRDHGIGLEITHLAALMLASSGD